MSLIENLRRLIEYRLEHNKSISNSCSQKSHKLVHSYDDYADIDITSDVASLIPDNIKSIDFKAYAIECSKCHKWKCIRIQGLNCQYLSEPSLHIHGLRIDTECQHHDNIYCKYEFVNVFKEAECPTALIRVSFVCHCCQHILHNEHMIIHLNTLPVNCNFEEIKSLILSHPVRVKNIIFPKAGYITDKYWVKYTTKDESELEKEYKTYILKIYTQNA